MSMTGVQTTTIEPDISDSIESTREEVPGPVGFDRRNPKLASIGAETAVAVSAELVGVVEVPAVGEIDRLPARAASPEPTPPNLAADELPSGAEIVPGPKRELDHQELW